MSLLERLKRVFQGKDVPSETKRLFLDAGSTRDLLKGLDDVITRNEVEIGEITKEIEGLEELEQTEIEKIRSRPGHRRAKQNALRAIRRLRRRMDGLDRRLSIHDRNLNLHMDLVGRIQAIEALEMGGVDEAEIENVLLEFENKFQTYAGALEMARADAVRDVDKVLDDTGELEALEREILSGAEPARGGAAPERAGPRPRAVASAGEQGDVTEPEPGKDARKELRSDLEID